MPRQNPTLADVAREAQVSAATVSRCLHGDSSSVRPDTFNRVLAAAQKLRYQVNTSAQSIARGRSRTIALIVADISDPFNAAIADGVLRAADTHNHHVVISAGNDPVRLVDALRGHNPQAMIVIGSRRLDPARNNQLADVLELFRQAGGSVTVVSQRGFPFHTIEIDNYNLSCRLATELTALGYRKFGVLSGPADLVTTADRVAGFTAGLAASGLHPVPQAIVHSSFDRDGGYRAVEGIAGLAPGTVDAIFAVNDLVAIGAMTRLRELGVRIPDEIAVAGFDDMTIATDVTPALTSMRIHMTGIGERAVEMALSPAAPGVDLHYDLISGEPIIRASTPERPTAPNPPSER